MEKILTSDSTKTSVFNGSSGLQDKLMCSSRKSLSSPSTSRLGSSSICRIKNPSIQSSEANQPADLWESILWSTIRTIPRRVTCPDSSQKAGFCPQSSQQASVGLDLSQSAVQHMESGGSEVAGELQRLKKRKEGETSSDATDLKKNDPVPKRACLTVRPEWALRIQSLLREKQQQRRGYSHTSLQNSTTDKLNMSTLNGSSGLQDKCLCSGRMSLGTAGIFGQRSNMTNSCHAETTDLQSSKPMKAADLWESVLCENPNNPTDIRMILRRVRHPDSSQKAGFCSQSSQQASVCPDLSQSAVQHMEGRASEVAGLNGSRKRKAGETSSDLLDLKMTPPVSKRACLTVQPKWVLQIRALFRERQRHRQGSSHTSGKAPGSRGSKRAASQTEGVKPSSAKRSST